MSQRGRQRNRESERKREVENESERMGELEKKPYIFFTFNRVKFRNYRNMLVHIKEILN